MNLEEITPVVLARDEEVNIGRTLAQLAWARQVIVVDSFSTDATETVAESFPNVKVLRRELDTLAGQSQFGIRQASTNWILLLDADFFVPPELVDELRELAPAPEVRAYRAAFDYAIDGTRLRASLYPARVVLLQREHSEVWQDGHAHRVLVDGATVTLRSKIVHDDRKPFDRFVARQKRYMRQEAEKLASADPRSLSLAGRVRKLIFLAPFAAAFHALFVRGLILDGRAGLRYAFERFIAESILSLELLRRFLRR